MKKLVCSLGLITLLGTSTSSLAWATENDIQVFINGYGTVSGGNQSAVMDNGRVLVPLRSIFEPLGAVVDWNQSTQTITATKGDKIITLPIGSKQATISGQPVELDQPAKIVNGSTLVPVRFVSEALGYEVKWDSDMGLVHIGNQEQAQEIMSQHSNSAVQGKDPLDLKVLIQSIYDLASTGKLDKEGFAIGSTYTDIKAKLGAPSTTSGEEGGMSIIYGNNVYGFSGVNNLGDLEDSSKVVMVGTYLEQDANLTPELIKRILGAPSLDEVSDESGKRVIAYNLNSYKLQFEAPIEKGKPWNIRLYAEQSNSSNQTDQDQTVLDLANNGYLKGCKFQIGTSYDQIKQETNLPFIAPSHGGARVEYVNNGYKYTLMFDTYDPNTAKVSDIRLSLQSYDPLSSEFKTILSGDGYQSLQLGKYYLEKQSNDDTIGITLSGN